MYWVEPTPSSGWIAPLLSLTTQQLMRSADLNVDGWNPGPALQAPPRPLATIPSLDR